MGYQFIHVDCWARAKGGGRSKKGKGGRTWSAAEIVAEAQRREGACPHIPAPSPPILLHGAQPEVALAMAEAWAAEARDIQGRRLRSDGACLLAGVITFPRDRPVGEWQEFRAASQGWLKKKWGQQLVSVVEHTDEEHPHFHFFCVPSVGSRFGQIHPGKAAVDRVREGKGTKKEENWQYRLAMKAFQDEFQEEVAIAHGLARLGPGRRRLTRGEWKAEQAVAKFQACEMHRIERSAELVDLEKNNFEEMAEMAKTERQRLAAARRELEEIIMEVKKQDEQRAKEIHRTAQDRISAGRMSIERQKIWEKKRDEFLIPPKELSHHQAERRRELARKYDYLMYPQDVRRRAVEASRQGGEALRQIETLRRTAREAQNSAEGRLNYLQDRILECKPWQILEKAKLATERREIEAKIAATRTEQKRLALAEKKLIASCPVEVVARYRYSQEDEREKAIAELLRREVAEAEAERREAAEAKERSERMAMRPTAPKIKKSGGWSPPSPG